tara:strand:+ start:1248 stop:1715 length:468 start_codon:yes stop_codon:yes gene_type:complete
MSKKVKAFTTKELGEYKQDDLRLNLIQDGDAVHRCTVDEKKTFLGFFEHWVHRADLMEPIRKVDREIQEAEDKLKALAVKRESKIREAQQLVASIPNSFSMQSYNLNAKDSKPGVHGVFASTSKKKAEPAKKKPTVLEGRVAMPENKQNNQKRNG